MPDALHGNRSVEESRTAHVVETARAIGFDLCGVANTFHFPELANMKEWLARGYAGEMKYLHDPRRASPKLVVENARSVIVCALNYNTDHPLSTEAMFASTPQENVAGPRGWISRYAWGDDYHDVMSGKLKALLEALRSKFPEPFEARAYVDTGPVAERVAAKYAGIGWLAKNTCVINEDLGSWFFLGVIVTNLDLASSLGPAETVPADLCGNCSLCIEACPTEAIVEPYVLDATRCISYLTIELRGEIPTNLRSRVGRHAFGCDICQDVCPWNRKSPITSQVRFEPRESDPNSLFAPSLEWLLNLSEEEFRERFRGSPVKRTKWRGLIRNACVAVGNSGLQAGEPRHMEICAKLAQLAHSEDPMIAEHARWSLERLGGTLPQGQVSPVVPRCERG